MVNISEVEDEEEETQAQSDSSEPPLSENIDRSGGTSSAVPNGAETACDQSRSADEGNARTAPANGSEQAESNKSDLNSSGTEQPEDTALAAEDAKVPEESDSDKARLAKAEDFKSQGNSCFSKQLYDEAEEFYSQALEAAPGSAPQRAIYFANRAACFLAQERYEDVIEDCREALEINPSYVKALTRRAQALERKEDHEGALTDLQKVLELEPGHKTASGDVQRLEPIVEKKREEMKEEMLGKLKDLGNTVLGKFGLSLDNFQATKDPNTGSYSINFQQ